MDAATNVFQPHPLVILHIGDIDYNWCSKSGERERKLWTGHRWVCLHCYPEQDPEKEQEVER